MAAPTLAEILVYLGNEVSADDDAVGAALAAEKASQAKRCRVPADDADWPADLAEALMRRVHRNLVLRGLPLGLATNVTDVAVSVTRVGLDVEVARLEAPYRKTPVG
jgi:hypothetical protein